jgi:hypothetical protein
MIVEKVPNKFICTICNYNTSRKSQFDRHLLTAKHKWNLNDSKNVPKEMNNICSCGKIYKFDTGYYRHKKKCIDQSHSQNQIQLSKPNINVNKEESVINNELVIELIKANKELKQLLVDQNNKMMDLIKDNKHVTNNTNNNNTNHFNLNFFLNEQCKNAINLMDFVSSLPLQLKDLEETARVGYVEGISKIFIAGIQQLDIYKRPIHCSDLKRETLYIRDKDIWEKEDKDKTKLKNAIKYVGSKNIKQIPEWVEKNPSCKDTTSKKNDEYMSLIINTMIGSSTEEQNDNVNKIVSKVVKEIVIEK